jgi:hypothetical protein
VNNFVNQSMSPRVSDSGFHKNAPLVSRVIRSIISHQYFREGQWTPDPSLADHFADAGKVVETCIRYHLSNVELVLKLETDPSGAFDTHLRLLDHKPRSVSVDWLQPGMA